MRLGFSPRSTYAAACELASSIVDSTVATAWTLFHYLRLIEICRGCCIRDNVPDVITKEGEEMRKKWLTKEFAKRFFLCGLAVATLFAQDPGQAPQPQYPPQGQYPPQSQYPPAQNQYPPPGQYPPYPQSQYPAPAPGQYPQYPQGQYPPPQYPAPPILSPQQVDQLAGPIALYPDGLLAQVLTASTFANQIPDAAAWANAHQYLKGDALAQAMRTDNLGFDPSVMTLLPFAGVLNYMAQYMGWTQALGNAVLAERDQVMDSVQRLRQEAYDYGYLRDSQYARVVMSPGAIEIVPITARYYFVPFYSPIVVFARPRPGFVVGGAIRFGGGITIGASFAPWGWAGVGFGWHEHTILVDHHPWTRTWSNRAAYAHSYAEPYKPAPGPRVEHHDAHEGHSDHHH